MKLSVSRSLLLLAATVANAAVAAPQRLDCILSDTDARSGVERRAIAINFDDQTVTMSLEEAGRTRIFTVVSISMTSMSGGEGDITVGVSRSSLRVVLQTYRKASVETEYGVCSVSLRQPSSATSPPVR